MSKSNYYCCVPKCGSWIKRNPDVAFHAFPSPNVRKEWFQGKLVDKREAWIKQLRIQKPVSRFMKVCSLHFTDQDYFKGSKVRRLKKTAVPSCKLPQGAILVKIKSRKTRNSQTRKRVEDKKRKDSERITDAVYNDHSYTLPPPVNFVSVNEDGLKTTPEDCDVAGSSGVFHQIKLEDDPLADHECNSGNEVITKREIHGSNDVCAENPIKNWYLLSTSLEFDNFGDGTVKCEVADFNDFPAEVKSEDLSAATPSLIFNQNIKNEDEPCGFGAYVLSGDKDENCFDTKIEFGNEEENVVIKSEVDDTFS